MSDDLQEFLAWKWKRRPDATPPLYSFLSDAAEAIVSLPTESERRGFLGHFAGELVTAGVRAGLPLGELRGLAGIFQNELTDAIVKEVQP